MMGCSVVLATNNNKTLLVLLVLNYENRQIMVGKTAADTAKVSLRHIECSSFVLWYAVERRVS